MPAFCMQFLYGVGLTPGATVHPCAGLVRVTTGLHQGDSALHAMR